MTEAITYHNALPLGSMLLEYRLESVLGAGGFGLTYLGWDTHLEKHVAIKEYLPGDCAIRALDGSVVPVNTGYEDSYQWGLDRFIQEARTLAKFTHPNIVRVNRFFEANGTSYMVMDYHAGESLNQRLRRPPAPDEAGLTKILMPVLDGLQAVHEAGFLHGDIKPSNVFIRANGEPLLLDFGSSRPVAASASRSPLTVVSSGYSALEQYSSVGNQGPWTDIYALAAVMYRAITGANPPEAVIRVRADNVAQALAAAQTRYSGRFVKAIGWGLTLDEKLRPQSVAEWRSLFLGRAIEGALSHGGAEAAEPRTRRSAIARSPSRTLAKSAGIGKWLAGAAVVLIVLIFSVTWSKRQPQPPAVNPETQASQPEAPVASAPRSDDPPAPAANQTIDRDTR